MRAGPICLTRHGGPFIIEIVQPTQLSRSVDVAHCAALRPDPARRCESSLIIWIVILLLFIASIVAAYFASRYWHWAHVTLVVFIFLAAVGYFVLAAEVLRINACLRKQANDLEAQLAQTKSNIDALDARHVRAPKSSTNSCGLEVHHSRRGRRGSQRQRARASSCIW